MNMAVASVSTKHFSDPVELVKHHLGREAVEEAIGFELEPCNRVQVFFPAGSMSATYCLAEQTVELHLPLWAREIGWECDQTPA